jgi:hypothetical protein
MTAREELIRTLVRRLGRRQPRAARDGCDGRNRVLASGVYFYQLTAGDQIARNKLFAAALKNQGLFMR